MSLILLINSNLKKNPEKYVNSNQEKNVTYYLLFFLATNNLWSKSATGHQGPSAVFVRPRLNATERKRMHGSVWLCDTGAAVNWYGTCATATSAPPPRPPSPWQPLHWISCSHVQSYSSCFLQLKRIKQTIANDTRVGSRRFKRCFAKLSQQLQTISLPLTFNIW